VNSLIEFISRYILRKRFSQFTLWTTYDGRKLRIKDMTNEHAANLILFLTHYSHPACKELRPVLIRMLVMRGVQADIMKDAPYPHFDKNGNLVIWDYDLDCTVQYEGVGNV